MPTKTFLAPHGPPSNPRALSRSRAWTCVLINQFAFPGMGTVMARRWTGYLQATIMLTGFSLTMVFMFGYFAGLVSFIIHSPGSDVPYKELCRPYAWAGLYGLGLCGVAWCWALVSSVAILRTTLVSRSDAPGSKSNDQRDRIDGEDQKDH